MHMMRFAALLALLIALPAQALELAGVAVEDKAKVGASELVLNGAGIRTRAIFKVYVGALYLTQKKANAAEAVAQAGAKRVSLTLLRDLSGRQLSEALNDGLEANVAATELAGLKTKVDDLLARFTDGKKGDVILLDYLPESGTAVRLNGEPRGKPIPGEDFYRALLRIWLGDKPVDGDLKKGMLGQAL